MLESISALNTTAWFNVVATYDANNKSAQVFINGQLDNSDTNINLDWTATYGNFQLGNSNWEPYYFNGSLDEVRVYNRVLSSSEIQTLYRAAGGR